MRSLDLVVETRLERTPRVKQLCGMFDVPAQEKLRHHWKGDLPLDERDWNIGLIVGPSGSGKSSVARELFGEPAALAWKAGAVIDDFDQARPMQDITAACSAVGFNTIPSWMKPFGVLSTGERFRVELARHLLEGDDLVLVDEFTSVVDRQVAQIGSYAVQKHMRKCGKKFVAVTCHYDVIEWLQPDWMLEPATMTFQWRSVQRRPDLQIEISRVDHEVWNLFAPYHYLTSELAKSAQCFLLSVQGVPASFVGIMHRPHYSVKNIKAISRIVTLPDFQGIGLAMVLADTMGAAYKAIGYRLRNYPAHPSFVRSHDRSPRWKLIKAPGKFSTIASRTSSLSSIANGRKKILAGEYVPNSKPTGINRSWTMGGRPCAVFEYCGAAMQDREQARDFLSNTAKIEEHLDKLFADGKARTFATIGGSLRQQGLLFSDTLMRSVLVKTVKENRLKRFIGSGGDHWRRP